MGEPVRALCLSCRREPNEWLLSVLCFTRIPAGNGRSVPKPPYQNARYPLSVRGRDSGLAGCSSHPIVGMTNSASARMPVSHRVVIVFKRV
jgi:hypothetical protein